MTKYTMTDRELPPKGVPLEWIAPSGEVVRGTFAGGAVWYPEGSTMYVYYVPVYWRALSVAQ